MELTGKCKEAFEKWYMKEYNKTEYTEFDFPHLEDFNDLHLTLKNGVLVDFFYSSISYYEFMQIFRDLVTDELKFNTNSLTEARAKAIEKASELFNNQKQIT